MAPVLLDNNGATRSILKTKKLTDMDPVLATSLIGAAGSLAESVGNGITNMQIARLNRKWQTARDLQNRAWALEDWNRQNEYNTPAAQMQRYSDAGLNPNLIYGQGSSGNSSGSPYLGGYSDLDESTAMPKISSNITDSVLSAYSSAVKRNSVDSLIQLNNAKEANIKADTLGKDIQNSIDAILKGDKILQGQYDTQLKSYSVSSMIQHLQTQSLDNALKQLDIDNYDRKMQIQERLTIVQEKRLEAENRWHEAEMALKQKHLDLEVQKRLDAVMQFFKHEASVAAQKEAELKAMQEIHESTTQMMGEHYKRSDDLADKYFDLRNQAFIFAKKKFAYEYGKDVVQTLFKEKHEREKSAREGLSTFIDSFTPW